MDDFEFLEDEDFIDEDDCILDDEFIRDHFSTIDCEELQNFPFVEDDIDAITDYELFSKGFGYLEDKKADKSELSEYAKKSDIPDTDDFVLKDEVSEVGLTGKYDDLLDKPELFSGDYDDLTNKPTIPTKTSELDNNSGFITKSVNDLTYYTKSSDLASVATSGDYDDLLDKPTIPDVSNFITKDVNDLTYYTLTSSLSSVATSGSYTDLSNTPTIPTVPTNVSSFNNDAGYITKSVNDLTNYTDTITLTTLLSGKENVSSSGSNTNGKYIKFDNGVMIQWNRIEVTDQAISNAYGSLYQGNRVFTFPVAFVGDLPSVQCSEFSYGSQASWGAVVGGETTLTQCMVRGFDIASRGTGTKVRIGYIAIGKWK